MELFYILLILLIVTRLFGELAARFSQPVLVGELLAGVALGMIVHTFEQSLPVLAGLSENEVFHAVTDLGIYFLMLLAGLEMRPADLYRSGSSAVWIAAAGMFLPLGLGAALGFVMLPDSANKLAQVLFLAVSLSITAVPITIATLMELGLHRSSVGKLMVSAAVLDDVLSLFLLAVLTSFIGGTQLTLASIGGLVAQVAAFFMAIRLVARYLFPMSGRLAVRLRIGHSEFSILMIWALALSVLAEALGMHFILGAYSAGLFFTRKTITEDVHRSLFHTVEAVTIGFFAPVFFASIGLSMRPGAVTGAPLFLGLLLAAAFAGKLLGAGLAAWSIGFSRRSALAIGVGMNARGAVELIVAGIALEAGLFLEPSPPPPVVANLFSSVVIVAIVTTVACPLVLQQIFRDVSPDESGDRDAGG